MIAILFFGPWDLAAWSLAMLVVFCAVVLAVVVLVLACAAIAFVGRALEMDARITGAVFGDSGKDSAPVVTQPEIKFYRSNPIAGRRNEG